MKKKKCSSAAYHEKYSTEQINEMTLKYSLTDLMKRFNIYACHCLSLSPLYDIVNGKRIGEKWKDVDVDGFEGLYQVSNFGRVKSLARDVIHKDGRVYHQDEKIRKQVFNNNGYLQCNLYKEGKQKMMRVNRSVASAFIPNPLNLETVNHKNEFDKIDNRVSNLEWLSRVDNLRYGTHDKRVAESQRNDPNRSKKVVQINAKNGEFVKTYLSTHDVERKSNGYFKNSNVCKCANFKYGTKEKILKPYKGYFFVWLKDLNNEEKAV